MFSLRICGFPPDNSGFLPQIKNIHIRSTEDSKNSLKITKNTFWEGWMGGRVGGSVGRWVGR